MTYELLRFRRGVRMAEGARVQADTLEQAKAKAAKLFYAPSDRLQSWYPEVFVEQTPENRTALCLRDAENES
jgi:hypothetical protein